MKLRPIPTGRVVTVGAYFPSVVAAAAASAAITAARLRPAVMELMDEAALAAISRYTGASLDRGAAYLLVQTDGGGAAEESQRVLEIVTASGAPPRRPRTRPRARLCWPSAGPSTRRSRRRAAC